MLLYTDVITNDELISDAYPLKDVDDVVYEVDCQKITIKQGDVDIGANASAEDAADDLEDDAQVVNNVVYSFRLQSTAMDKKSYMSHIKAYMKAVKSYLQEHNPDRVATFEKGAQAYVKKVISSFTDWDFYTGENMNPDGMVALLNYREDGVTPYLVFWKDGLKEVKL